MTTIGYARTSTLDQVAGLEDQERELKAAGADRIISERVSSVAERPGLTECLGLLEAGDVLMVTKPDRLARSTLAMLSIVDDLTRRNIGVIILSMWGGERMDTRNPTAKLILTVMAGVATWERESMLQRQRAGIEKAKAEGKFKGRKRTIDHAAVAVVARAKGARAAAQQFGVGIASVYRCLTPEG